MTHPLLNGTPGSDAVWRAARLFLLVLEVRRIALVECGSAARPPHVIAAAETTVHTTGKVA